MSLIKALFLQEPTAAKNLLLSYSCIFLLLSSGAMGTNAAEQEMHGICFTREAASTKILKQLGPCKLHFWTAKDNSVQLTLSWKDGLHRIAVRRQTDGSILVNGKQGYEISDDSRRPQSV